MRKLQKPTDNPEDVFLDCISNIRNSSFKARLLACKNEIIKASQEFETKAVTVELHTINTQDKVANIVLADEMVKIYKTKLAKKRQPGRKYYDKIISAAPQGICPLCGQRTVSTLDHHLAKSKYPALAVAPNNLIPSCSDCNKKKLDTSPSSSEEETIHPYFDNFEDNIWLYAEVIKSAPIALRFFVSPPTQWDLVKKKRVQFHFNIFCLLPLYSSHAAVEINNIHHQLIQLFHSSGPDAVQKHLLESAMSREKAHLNSWQAAMYRALANSNWFYTEGVIL